MDATLLVYSLLGAVIAFASTLPLGPINLTVAKITVDKNHWRGFEASAVAAMVEMVQILIAAFFGMVISSFLEDNPIFRVAVAVVFILIGVIFYRREPRTNIGSDAHYFGSEIKTGFMVAVLNPQAIPFWIIALAAINEYTDLVLEGRQMVFFLAGAYVGKMCALTAFIVVANYVRTHLAESGRLINRILGAVLIVLGTIQLIRILFA